MLFSILFIICLLEVSMADFSEAAVNKTQSMSSDRFSNNSRDSTAPLVTPYNKYMACTCLKTKTAMYDYAAIRVVYTLYYNNYEDTVYLKMNGKAISQTESRFDAVILFEYMLDQNRYIDMTVICEARSKNDASDYDDNWVVYDNTEPWYTPFICQSNTNNTSVQRIVNIQFDIPNVINAAPLSMRLHPNNVMMDMYERDRYHSLYYEYEEGERVTVDCSITALPGSLYYLEFNGTVARNKSSMSKQLQLTSADDYTLFECSLCFLDCKKELMRQIYVMFRKKTPPPANIIKPIISKAGLRTNSVVMIACAAGTVLLLLMLATMCYHRRRHVHGAVQRAYEHTLSMRPGLVTPIPSVSSRSSSLLDMFPTSTYDYTYCAGAGSAIAAARARAQAIDAVTRHRYSDAAESHQYVEIDDNFVQQLKARLNQI